MLSPTFGRRNPDRLLADETVHDLTADGVLDHLILPALLGRAPHRDHHDRSSIVQRAARRVEPTTYFFAAASMYFFGFASNSSLHPEQQTKYAFPW